MDRALALVRSGNFREATVMDSPLFSGGGASAAGHWTVPSPGAERGGGRSASRAEAGGRVLTNPRSRREVITYDFQRQTCRGNRRHKRTNRTAALAALLLAGAAVVAVGVPCLMGDASPPRSEAVATP